MNEEERVCKVRRMVELRAERVSLFDITPEEIGKEPRILKDLVLARNKNNDEWTILWHELYPEPPKDLFEDIKKRTEKMKDLKRWHWPAAQIKKGFMARIFSLIK